jgi:membrane protein
VDVLRNVAAESQKSRLPQMAAALSYRTIFGLLPTIVVALLGLRAFATDQDIDELVERTLKFAGLSQIEVSDAGEPETSPVYSPEEPPPGGDAGPGAAPTEPEPAKSSQSLAQAIKQLVDRAGTINFRAISIVGIALLIYAAISMLVEIERAFNQIYRVPIGKSWSRRVTQYWTILTLGTLFLFGTFYFGARFQQIVVKLAGQSGLATAGAVWVGAVGYSITVVISTTLFLLMYVLVPNTRVKVLPALAGAFVAALLWEGGKWGFTQYLAHSTGYARLYGSIALIPLFLLWIYVTWIIVLLGLQVSYFLQHTRHRTIPEPRLELEPAIVDPASALIVMESVARGFQAGRPAPVAEIARQAGLPQGITEQLVSRLVERGMVLRVGEREQAAYTLARPPEGIAAAEVLGIGYELAGRDGAEEAGGDPGVLQRLRQAQIQAAGTATLLSLMGGGVRPEPGPGVSAASSRPAPEPQGRAGPNPSSNGREPAGADTLEDEGRSAAR